MVNISVLLYFHLEESNFTTSAGSCSSCHFELIKVPISCQFKWHEQYIGIYLHDRHIFVRCTLDKQVRALSVPFAFRWASFTATQGHSESDSGGKKGT